MRWKLRHGRSIFTLVCALAALSGGCKLSEPRTQVTLFIDADAKVRELVSDLQVAIEGRDALDQIDGPPGNYAFRPKEPSSTGWPFSIALVPRSRELKRSYRITATVSDGATVIAVLRAQGGFVAKKTLALSLYFSKGCLNGASLNCSNQETCQGGSCVSANIDARTLPAYEVGSLFAAGGAADGGAVAASSDSPPVSTNDSGAGAMSPMAGSGGVDDDASVVGPRSDAPGDCGDGKLNPGELCDTGIAQGEGACPTACASDGCVSAAVEGTGCQTQCVQYQNSTVSSGDGCCPAGADSTTDSDCVAQCGNGMVESGETCEASDPLHPCATLDTCQADKCIIAAITGDAALCTALCETQLMEQCLPGDGCCPSACTHDIDSDCSASCGNGVVDATAGETCDKNSVATPCPTSCDDGDVCTRDYLSGSTANCSASCSYVPITTPFSGDGCCPQGANASNDLDCTPLCGNGVVERGEVCDTNCPAQGDCEDRRPCTLDELSGSDCTVTCKHTEVRTATDDDFCCPSGGNANSDNDCQPACGNGVRESGEDCDGDCPITCPQSGLACTRTVVSGTPCHLECVTQRITLPSHDDGCCPSGATTANDNDCMPAPVICGNNRVEAGETCDGNCPVCADTNPCTRDVTGGVPCNPTCAHLAASVGAMDGCCPQGASSSSDPDCRPTQVCGNGTREGDEVCDGNCGSCAQSANPCTVTTRVNMPDACHPECVITQRASSGSAKDGCCPNGSTASQDADCAAVCGNGKVETGEVCDGNCQGCPPQADPCQISRPVPNPDACHPKCTVSSKGASGSMSDRCCPSGLDEYQDIDCPARCGNGVLETGEVCDSTATPSPCPNCRSRAPSTPTPSPLTEARTQKE